MTRFEKKLNRRFGYELSDCKRREVRIKNEDEIKSKKTRSYTHLTTKIHRKQGDQLRANYQSPFSRYLEER